MTTSMNVIEYCTEEVSRQGHNLYLRDGIERVGWMLDAWTYALKHGADDCAPTLRDVVALGKLIERKVNKSGIRKHDVSVYFSDGTKFRKMPYQLVRQELTLLCDIPIGKKSPLEWYRQFEEIHPFADGNGRVGKVLLNWLNGTLLNPIFPPNDFWGKSIANP